jgi:hypothetical protein
MTDVSCSPELLGSVISATSDHGNNIGRKRRTSRAHLGLQTDRKRDGVDEQLDGTDGSKLQDPGEGKPWIQSEK